MPLRPRQTGGLVGPRRFRARLQADNAGAPFLLACLAVAQADVTQGVLIHREKWYNGQQDTRKNEVRDMSPEMAVRLTHVDMELMRVRLSLSPGQRIQAMLDARALLVGIMRGRLRQKYPDLSEVELNLRLLEEIERARSVKAWPQSLSAYPP